MKLLDCMPRPDWTFASGHRRTLWVDWGLVRSELALPGLRDWDRKEVRMRWAELAGAWGEDQAPPEEMQARRAHLGEAALEFLRKAPPSSIWDEAPGVLVFQALAGPKLKGRDWHKEPYFTDVGYPWINRWGARLLTGTREPGQAHWGNLNKAQHQPCTLFFAPGARWAWSSRGIPKSQKGGVLMWVPVVTGWLVHRMWETCWILTVLTHLLKEEDSSLPSVLAHLISGSDQDLVYGASARAGFEERVKSGFWQRMLRGRVPEGCPVPTPDLRDPTAWLLRLSRKHDAHYMHHHIPDELCGIPRPPPDAALTLFCGLSLSRPPNWRPDPSGLLPLFEEGLQRRGPNAFSNLNDPSRASWAMSALMAWLSGNDLGSQEQARWALAPF